MKLIQKIKVGQSQWTGVDMSAEQDAIQMQLSWMEFGETYMHHLILM